MDRINATSIRNNFADIINRVAYAKERIVLHRRGKDLAVVIPMEDFDLLKQILNEKKKDLQKGKQEDE